MPYYYFDSTALVKRYSMERGTRIVNKLMVKRGKVAILPTWTVTELYSAFSNRAQQGELTRDDSTRSFINSSGNRRKDCFNSSCRRWRPIFRRKS